MDGERTEAIVLRLQPVTESSLLVTWFTREFGKLKTLAKGARRPKSSFRGKIDLFYLDEIVFLRSKRSDLHLLQDCFLDDPHRKLRNTVETLTAASYVCELVEVGTEREDANPKIFELLAGILGELERAGEPALLIWFELQLLAATGWKPKWEKRAGVSRVLASLAAASLKAARRVRLSEAQAQEARQVLWQFSDVQFGRAPRARRFLR
jgi:DNA repair protein RecO (recombination protein O)